MRVNTKILPKLFYAGLHLASKPTNDHWTVGCTWRRSPNEIPAGSIRNMAHGMAYEDAADWPILRHRQGQLAVVCGRWVVWALWG